MKTMLPQEIEVWYVIPALRRELARIIVEDRGLTQKKASTILGITEAAISQYLGRKRGKELIFSKNELKKINNTADKILDDKENMSKHLYELCLEFRGIDIMCKLHRRMDSNVSKNCDMCIKKN